MVVDGIAHALTAALDMGRTDLMQSKEEIASIMTAALKDLRELNCWYEYDVHVIVGRKA